MNAGTRPRRLEDVARVGALTLGSGDHAGMRFGLRSLTLVLVMAACSPDSGIATTSSPSVAPAPTVSVTTTSTTTTTTSTTTTTTTTVPPLDRSDAAAIERMQRDLAVLLSNGPRVSGTPSEAAAVRYFSFRSEAITGSPSTIQVVPLPDGRVSGNAWSAEVGSGDRLLLLGSHLDTIAGSPGADDNGSGAVVLLELLRRLVATPPQDLRVVVVGFGAEEYVPGYDHHYGSELAVEQMEASATLPDFMVSVDMVGMGSEIHAVDYDGIAGSMVGLLIEAAADAGADMIHRSRGDISDHVPFALAGVPAALLWRGDNPDYHQAGDDSVEDEALLENLRILEALIEFIASS